MRRRRLARRARWREKTCVQAPAERRRWGRKRKSESAKPPHENHQPQWPKPPPLRFPATNTAPPPPFSHLRNSSSVASSTAPEERRRRGGVSDIVIRDGAAKPGVGGGHGGRGAGAAGEGAGGAGAGGRARAPGGRARRRAGGRRRRRPEAGRRRRVAPQGHVPQLLGAQLVAIAGAGSNGLLASAERAGPGWDGPHGGQPGRVVS
uniref:Uncharacterized protein n=1 Tax=Oryza rufipogon TaxID=4529 RepID=A0A0E0Q9U9_ORYRU